MKSENTRRRRKTHRRSPYHRVGLLRSGPNGYLADVADTTERKRDSEEKTEIEGNEERETERQSEGGEGGQEKKS